MGGNPSMEDAIASLLERVETDYSLTHSEWVAALRVVATCIEDDISEGEGQ